MRARRAPGRPTRRIGWRCDAIAFRRVGAIIIAVKQLIARIDDGLHARLKLKAAQEGRSLNALVTDALEASASAGRGPGEMIEQRAAERGIRLVSTRTPRRSVAAGEAANRNQVIDSTRGLGAFIDDCFDEDRGSRER